MKRKDYVSQTELPQWRGDNKPECCPLFGIKDFDPVVDHDHVSGRIRAVISREANAMLGKIENFYKTRGAKSVYSLSEVLRQMADYVDAEQTGPLPPLGTRQVTKRFGRMSKTEQVTILTDLGIEPAALDEAKNSAARTKLYRSLIVK